MSIALSKLAVSVQPSATLAAAAKARQLKAAGVTVYDFSLGEPDQATPSHVCQAAADAMAAGHTHYTPVAGIPELRTAIANWYRSYHGYEFDPANVVVANGAKHALHNSIVATCGPGDDVIIPTPYWVSYSDIVSMAGAKPVLVPTTFESGFKLTPGQLKNSLTPHTKLVMLNSPNNPTGTVYSRAELERLTDVILNNTGVSILSDEIYEQLCYGDAKPTCVASLRPELAGRTITVSGASKSHAMTGWRMGWAIAPPPVAKAMADIQSQETGCTSSISQYAALAALSGPQDCVAKMRAEYEGRRAVVTERLQAIPKLRLHPGKGTFYAFFDVSAYLDRFGPTSAAFCNRCLEEAHVNFMPGAAFGAEGFVRMSYACSRATIEAGLDRFAAWLAS